MQRENREEELDALIAKYRTEGKNRVFATYAAMRDMGFKSGAKERKLWQRFLGEGMVNRRRQNNRDFKKKYYRKMRNQSLFDAIAAIEKDNATPEQEMDWVASHPKFLQALDQWGEEGAEPVKVVAEDCPASGTPSRSAVGRLMAAVKDPLAWQKKRLDADKSKTGAGSGGEGDTSDVTDDLEEIERMIKAASNG
jgi:hypothetical protein